MQNSRRVRFTGILGAGASMVLGTAGMLVSSALFAAEACTPAGCTPTSPTCQQCDQVFSDAAEKLKNLNPGCCPAPACAAPSACADVCNPDAVFNAGCNGGCGGKSNGELGDPWTLQSLFANPCKPDKGWQIGGWTSFGYRNNPDGSFAGNAQVLDDRQEWDRFALDQQYFYIGKTANGNDGVGFGFRMDMIYGLDGNEAQSFGNNPGEFDFLNGWDHGSYEWAMPQLYGEVAVGNHTAKIGHFYTLLGYEVIPATGNFFSSRQLTFYNSEPFTHTGVLVASKVSDRLTLHNGWVLGMDTGFDQLGGGNAYHGGFIFQATEATSLTYMAVFGDLGWRGNGAINSVVMSHQWTDRIQTVHQFDVFSSDLELAKPLGPFGFLQADVPANFAIDGIARNSIGLINYAFYEFNDRLKAGVRQEWYKADSVSYYTLTYGVNVKPHANVIVRPEVRHMWSPGNDLVYGDGEDLYNQTVFGVDAIVTY
uniref:Porin n=1 Tax=Schlesneria paludicola TaxID=360056 RepID=A0A7C2P2H2_9PLAN